MSSLRQVVGFENDRPVYRKYSDGTVMYLDMALDERDLGPGVYDRVLDFGETIEREIFLVSLKLEVLSYETLTRRGSIPAMVKSIKEAWYDFKTEEKETKLLKMKALKPIVTKKMETMPASRIVLRATMELDKTTLVVNGKARAVPTSGSRSAARKRVYNKGRDFIEFCDYKLPDGRWLTLPYGYPAPEGAELV